MPQIIRFHETGCADVLKIEDLPLAEPGEGEVCLIIEAISLNRAEFMFREGNTWKTRYSPHDLAMKQPGS